MAAVAQRLVDAGRESEVAARVDVVGPGGLGDLPHLGR